MQNGKKIAINIVYSLATLSLILLITVISLNNLLPPKHRLIFITMSVFMYLGLGLLILKKSENRYVYYISIIFLSILFIIQSYLSFIIFKTYYEYNKRLKESSIQTTEYSIITRKDNPINNISEIKNKDIYYDKLDNQKDIQAVIEIINRKNNSIKYKGNNNIISLANDLLVKKIDYVLLNNAKLSLIDNVIPSFKDKYKIIKIGNDENIKLEKEMKEAEEVKSGQSFTVFISGADTYETLDGDTRSDVNILVTINPKTNKILMTSLPRDSYVMMTNLGKDKLTHAGTYGIETLLSTVENLLDVKINYYAKVNFASLEKLVDILGGVRVHNEQSFTSRTKGLHFEEGDIDLNGEQALEFVRERYSFDDGDFARGRNQMKVMKAMIEKALSPKILFNYTSFLGVALDNIYTNFPTSKITEMINKQLEEPKNWEILQSQVKGEPTMSLPSFTMPDYTLSMTELDEDSLKENKMKIQEILK